MSPMPERWTSPSLLPTAVAYTCTAAQPGRLCGWGITRDRPPVGPHHERDTDIMPKLIKPGLPPSRLRRLLLTRNIESGLASNPRQNPTDSWGRGHYLASATTHRRCHYSSQDSKKTGGSWNTLWIPYEAPPAAAHTTNRRPSGTRVRWHPGWRSKLHGFGSGDGK